MTLITCHLMGGLGNQLFQIFATIAFALETKKPFAFLYTTNLAERSTYWSNFLESLKGFTKNTIPNLPILREKGFKYNKLVLPQNTNTNTNNINDGCKLFGYFQSHKYFEERYETLLRFIRLRPQQEKIRRQIQGTQEGNPFLIFENPDLVSMHFRLGDYKKLQKIHPLMSFEYYRNSIFYIIEKTGNAEQQILYFCEKADNDDVTQTIDRLKLLPELSNVTFIKADDTVSDWEQLLMMSCCHHNIIANSTFSWWGAYFNENSDKIICYPEVWFGPDMLRDHGVSVSDDLFPNEWTKISNV